MDGTPAAAGVLVAAGLPVARAAGGTMTRGCGHGPAPLCGTAARAPEFSVSQPSAGQVRDSIVCTTSEPTEPSSASRQSTGVTAADTSVQRRPGMPTRTTGRGGEAAGVAAAIAAGPADQAATRTA